jgi:predicted ATPase
LILTTYTEDLTGSRGRLARYRLLETVRQYALELLLGSGELPALRERHLEFANVFPGPASPRTNIAQPRPWRAAATHASAALNGRSRSHSCSAGTHRPPHS